MYLREALENMPCHKLITFFTCGDFMKISGNRFDKIDYADDGSKIHSESFSFSDMLKYDGCVFSVIGWYNR